MKAKWTWEAKRQAESLNAMIDEVGATPHVVQEDNSADARLPLQRDRDRIIWSPSFKRLAHKTQVFPHLYSDHQRHRLTHSLEVMQLASSIARTLGLNPILCEAIAFAHDLGHTPFGHAGESTIDDAFRCIKLVDKDANVRGLERFSHYEHGIDIVSYIDSPDPERQADGLHLAPDILEGIFLHTYDHHPANPQKHKNLAFLKKYTKYDFLRNIGPGSLEAQAVRICDKITYFISDIEDGLIIEAINLDQLSPWKKTLFRPVFDLAARRLSKDDQYRVFRSARDSILTYVVTSLLRRGCGGDPKTIRIEPEEFVKEELKDVYHDLQSRMFDDNIYLLRANHRANHIVSCLLCQYFRHPELIPWRFRRKYQLFEDNAYHETLAKLYLRKKQKDGLRAMVDLNLMAWHAERFEKYEVCNEPRYNLVKGRTISQVICVKDYVAGMTDNYAEVRYRDDVDCPTSRRTWEARNMAKTTYYDIATIV